MRNELQGDIFMSKTHLHEIALPSFQKSATRNGTHWSATCASPCGKDLWDNIVLNNHPNNAEAHHRASRPDEPPRQLSLSCSDDQRQVHQRARERCNHRTPTC